MEDILDSIRQLFDRLGSSAARCRSENINLEKPFVPDQLIPDMIGTLSARHQRHPRPRRAESGREKLSFEVDLSSGRETVCRHRPDLERAANFT